MPPGDGTFVAMSPVARQSRRVWQRLKEILMPFVVTEPCRGCKYTDCVTVCPVESFYQDEQMVYIDPETCIDCDACAAECPVEAIFHEDNVPEQWTPYVLLNLER